MEKGKGNKQPGRGEMILEREFRTVPTVILHFSQFLANLAEKERHFTTPYLLDSGSQPRTVVTKPMEYRIKRSRDRRTNQTRPTVVVSPEKRMLPLGGQDNLNFPTRCTASTYLDHSAKQNQIRASNSNVNHLAVLSRHSMRILSSLPSDPRWIVLSASCKRSFQRHSLSVTFMLA